MKNTNNQVNEAMNGEQVYVPDKVSVFKKIGGFVKKNAPAIIGTIAGTVIGMTAATLVNQKSNDTAPFLDSGNDYETVADDSDFVEE